MIVHSKDYLSYPADRVGGKGMNLLDLNQAAFNVPPFFILTTEWFRELQTEIEVKEKAGSLSEELATLEGSLFAVRSSANAEDSSDHSFAGQFKTHLNVPADGIADAIASVWASKNSDQVATYKKAADIGQDLQMAVIVQVMIPATASGVAFGINPLNGNIREKVINAIPGLGEDLVSGRKNADGYIVTGHTITEKKIVGDDPVLTDEQILLVDGLLRALQELYNKPWDIEFSFQDNELYLLQCRPVTAVRKEKKIVWDNSNIVESYPGLTLPLTFSFIEKMYEAVYRQFSLVLGVPAKRVDANKDVYANMLGLLNGRVYYNLNSWYLSLAELPGYSVNAEFMEKMMGVKEKPQLDLPPREKAGFGDYLHILGAVGHIARNRFTAKKQKDEFIRAFEDIYGRFDKKDRSQQTPAEILTDYHQFEQMMVSKWKAPLVNDFFAMIYFGVLQKICAKHLPEDKNLHNELVSSSKDIITTEPLRLLPMLAKKIASHPELEQAFLHQQPRTLWGILHQQKFREQLEEINKYLEAWGERTVAELKLETITYRQQPEKLLALLQSYIRNKLFQYQPDDGNEKKRRQAEEKLFDALKNKFIAKKTARHVLDGARYFISNRENLRYYRTKGFGMVRRIFLALGDKLASEGMLDNNRDIFYLRLDELEQIVVKKLDEKHAARIIEARKKNYELYQSLPLPERIETYGPPPEFIVQPQKDKDNLNSEEWQGIPCSAGVVRARVRKLHEADAVTSLSENILATYATDPGWVVLFPSASGIITERGSLLSHAAIVSREMGIPCIVGVTNLMETLEDGAEVIMDGSTGIIRMIKNQEHDRL